MNWIQLIYDWFNTFGYRINNEYYDIANPGKTRPMKGR